MDTKIIKLDDDFSEKDLILPAACLKRGGLVAFPTETVYGLGANALDERACKKIFQVKGRPQDNPLICHIGDLSFLQGLVVDVGKKYQKMMGELWPGPLTLIFKKDPGVPDTVSGGGDSLGVRMPDNRVALSLIRETGLPIAAPSANKSGRPSPTNARDVYEDLKGEIDYIIDYEESDIGIESTVLDLTSDRPTILRPGFYTLEDIRAYLPDAILDASILKDGERPKSPGQKYKHYSPKADYRVYIGPWNKVRKKMEDEIEKNSEKKIGLLLFDQHIDDIDLDCKISLGNEDNLKDMSHRLFSSLREMDRMGVDLILGQGVAEEKFGVSIMNRVKKATGGQVYYL